MKIAYCASNTPPRQQPIKLRHLLKQMFVIVVIHFYKKIPVLFNNINDLRLFGFRQ